MDFAQWRARARTLLAQNVAPEHASWEEGGRLLESAGAARLISPTGEATRFNPEHLPQSTGGAGTPFNVPRRLLDVLERAYCHRPRPEALMYRLLWRAKHGEDRLLDDAADDDVIRVTRMARAVDRACHKMTAFVRFRAIDTEGAVRYVAWFEPEHDVLARTAPFFVRRFATMHWAIATPAATACWDGHALFFRPTDRTVQQPSDDDAEDLWLTYYASIFNPARLNVAMMRKEMPMHYWKNLPEAASIPALVAAAPQRAGRMVEDCLVRDVAPYRHSTGPRHIPATVTDQKSMPDSVLKSELDACRRCPLGATATQAVPGRGPRGARLMLVGEQPGDEEDLSGLPFVGPAGRLLDTVLARAGIDRADVYLTNAVKHFGFEPRGKRRIHKTPAQRDIVACRSWLEAEIAARSPRVIVALGVTALKSLITRTLTLNQARTLDLIHPSGAQVIATFHPAAVLRAPNEDIRKQMLDALKSDLDRAAAFWSRATLKAR